MFLSEMLKLLCKEFGHQSVREALESITQRRVEELHAMRSSKSLQSNATEVLKRDGKEEEEDPESQQTHELQ